MTLKDMYIRLMIDKWCLDQTAYDTHKAVTEKKQFYEDLMIAHKRELRAKLKDNHDKYLYHKADGTGYGKIVAYGGNYDSFWEKIFFEGEHWTDEEKDQFVADNWITARPSQYDCTGQVFTWAINVFNTPNGVVAYIRNAIDV